MERVVNFNVTWLGFVLFWFRLFTYPVRLLLHGFFGFQDVQIKQVNCKISTKNVNNEQIFHAFLFNIRNYSPEVINIQRREAEVNIILPRVNNFERRYI